MVLVEDPRSTYVPELGQDITFVYTACSRGRMSGLFTQKFFTSRTGTWIKLPFHVVTLLPLIVTSYAVVMVLQIPIAMATASVRTVLQWLLKKAQPFSAALMLVDMRSSPVNEYALKLKSISISGNYA